MLQKTTQLRNMLNSGQTEFILEAHNGLSARIVEETGFKGIGWISTILMIWNVPVHLKMPGVSERMVYKSSKTAVLTCCIFVSYKA